jgi:hypothetical protein
MIQIEDSDWFKTKIKIFSAKVMQNSPHLPFQSQEVLLFSKSCGQALGFTLPPVGAGFVSRG